MGELVPTSDMPKASLSGQLVPDHDLPSKKTDHSKDALSDSSLENFTAGIGQGMAQMGRSLKSIGDMGADTALAPNKAAARKQDAADQASADQTDKALLSTKAGMAGNMTANAIPFALAPEGYAGAAAAGAVTGALAPADSTGGRGLNTALGAAGGVGGQAAGNVIGAAIGRVVQPLKSAFSEGQQAAVDLLKKAGVDLSAGQQTGSSLGGAVSEGLAKKQAGQFTSAALEDMGVVGEKEASPAVMNKRVIALGKGFDDVATRTPIKVTTDVMGKLSNIEQVAGSELQPSQMHVISKQLDNIIGAGGDDGTISGAAYSNTRQALQRLEMGQDTGIAHFAGQLRETLDGTLAEQAAPEDAAALTKLRQQWQSYKQISKAIDGPDNQINPKMLANGIDTVRNANQTVLGRGNQSLWNLAQAGKAVISNQAANSGAAMRLMAQSALGAGLGVADALRHGHNPWEEGGAGAAVALGLGKIAGMVTKSALENPAFANMLGNRAASTAVKGYVNAIKSRGATMFAIMAANAGSRIQGTFVHPDQPQAQPDEVAKQAIVPHKYTHPDRAAIVDGKPIPAKYNTAISPQQNYQNDIPGQYQPQASDYEPAQ